MANLTPEFSIPLKAISVRLNHMKANLPGIMKVIEKKAIHNQKSRKDNSDDINLLLTWDDWIYAALEVDHETQFKNKQSEKTIEANLIEKMLNKHKSVPGLNNQSNQIGSVYEKALTGVMNHYGKNPKKPNWAKNLEVGQSIPKELLDRLPVTVGELVTLGSWMLTKNVYRFEDIVIKEILKSDFNGTLPSYIINLPDICTYIQTDNADLYFEDCKVIGVIFCVTELCEQRVLITNMYLDTGLPRTIVITLQEDQDIESSLGDFIDEFQYDADLTEHEDEISARLKIQKKLINLVLWFSQTKPDYIPLLPENHKEPKGFKEVKKEKRLFEASKYKPFLVGGETSKVFNQFYKEYDDLKKHLAGSGKRMPHLRKSHWHLYWYGKKGANERYDFKLLPITMVGGIPKP